MSEAVGERRTLLNSLLASGLVAATFFYFLLFAQFALLHRIEELDADKVWLQPVMLLMGGGGLIGCVLAWLLFTVRNLKRLLILGFLGCSGLGYVAGVADGIEVFLGIGFLVGVFLGLLTVVVVPSLRLLLASGQIGRWAGLGTGLAYFGSNVPFVFQQSAGMQCLIAAGVALLGSVLAVCLPKSLDANRLKANAGEKAALGGLSFGRLLGLMFILVWLDSAAFYVIQETSVMRDETWGSVIHLWGNGVVHLVFGLVSGVLLDGGRQKMVLGTAMGLLVGGCLWLRLGYSDLGWLGASLYVGGVSLYSTSLVASLAQAGEWVGGWTLVKRAAVLFAVAGWIGSGLGIGMARDLGTVPYAFLGLAAALAFALLAVGAKGLKGARG